MKHPQLSKASAYLVMVVMLFSGCASMGPVPPQFAGQERPDYGRIGLATARFPPMVKVDVLTHGKGEGARKGAGWGALYGLNIAAQTGLLAIFLAPILVPVGATVGAIKGASETESSDKISVAESTTRVRLEALKSQEIIRDEVIRYAQETELTGFVTVKGQGPQSLDELPSYHPEANEPLDTVVELGMVSFIGENTGEKGLPTQIEMTFRVRVIHASDGKVLDSYSHTYRSGYWPYEALAANNAKLLADIIQSGYREFAEVVVDEVFLNYRQVAAKETTAGVKPIARKADSTDSQKSSSSVFNEPVSDGQEKSSVAPDYTLQPVYPEPRLNLNIFSHVRTAGFLDLVEVDSIEPTLRWEPLPRLSELSQTEVTGRRLTDLKYDVRIFNSGEKLGHLFPFELKEQVTGLIEPSYKPTLEPCHLYFWTVRARFKLDGKVQATEWSGRYMGKQPWWWRRDSYSLRLSRPNSWNYFPFRTPAASPSETCPKDPRALLVCVTGLEVSCPPLK